MSESTVNDPKKTVTELLMDCLTAEGRIDPEKVVGLAAEGKINPAEAAGAIALNDTVQGAVNKGIFKPMQFKVAVGWALRDKPGFDTFLATTTPQIPLETVGVNLTDTHGNSRAADPNNKESVFLKLTDDLYARNRAINPAYTHEQALLDASRQDPNGFDGYRNATTNLADRPPADSPATRLNDIAKGRVQF